MAVKPTPSAADYAAYQQDVDGTQRLAELDALEASANDLYSAIQALEQAELDLKRAKARVAYLSEEAIPNQMEQLGLELTRPRPASS